MFPVQRDCKLHGAGPSDGLGVGGVLGGGGEGRTDQAGHTAQPRAVWYQHSCLLGFCWFGSLDGCLDIKIFVYTKNICVRVFPVPCPVSAVAELSPIVHNSVSMSPDCECIQSCQMLKRLSRITVICMSYYHLIPIRSLTLFTNNILNIQE